MKSLARQSDSASDNDLCAAQVLSTVPMVMRRIRGEMRRRRPAGLSVPQFRAMGFVCRRGGVSLSDVAEFMGITLPTVSKMMDTLVKRGLVLRQTSSDDRRYAVLRLTEQGRSAYDAAEAESQAYLANALKGISPSEREEIVRAMQTLRQVFFAD